MRQVIAQRLTGRYAIIKIFPFIHALKVEVEDIYADEELQDVSCSDTHWRLATDKDILQLNIPVSKSCSTKQQL